MWYVLIYDELKREEDVVILYVELPEGGEEEEMLCDVTC